MGQLQTLDDLRRTLATTAAAERPRLVEAIAATCLLVARADGEVSAPEIDRIAAAVSQLADPGAAEGIEHQLAGDWKELQVGGLESLLGDIARRLTTAEQRRLALACAAAVAYADGHFDFEEELLLDRLAAAFGVSADEARAIVHHARPGRISDGV